MSLRFDNRVVIVTGAGNGLGRAYALQFAARGAKVLVNDLGTSTSGEGNSSRAADLVVEEIRKLGGEAVANYDSVENGAAIVKTAVDKWGRVDVVINNAGILRDVSFMKMKDQEWDIIQRVHLYGAYSVTRAAWNLMREQGFGRVIVTSSAAGLYGNFGQANYSAAKLALVGFARTLAKEGEKRNVFCNAIAPVAGTRMTESVMPPDLVAALKPEYIAPLVLYLCHESSQVNGGVFEVGAGWISQVRWQRSRGHFFPLDQRAFTPELIRDNWSRVADFSSDVAYPQSPSDSVGTITAYLEKQKTSGGGGGGSGSGSGGGVEPQQQSSGNANVDLRKVMAWQPPVQKFTYTQKEAALYALSVGTAQNPMDEKQLPFVYENSPEFRVLPSFGVVVPFAALDVTNIPGLQFNPMMLLHGEQYLQLKRPLPPSGTLTSQARVAGLYDKGKGALLVLETTTRDERGQELCVNQYSMFIRGLGGFGGERGPAQEPNSEPPARTPDATATDRTADNLALFYRWTSGDLNPLHADPNMAAVGGFQRPILHGLCTFGHASRAVLQHFAHWDPARIRSLRARFSKHVFPGETLVTEMWRVAPTRVLFRVKVQERNEYAIVGGVAELVGDAAAAPAGGAAGGGASTPRAAAATAAASSAASASGSESEFKSAALFNALGSKLPADAVKKINGVYQFDLTSTSGKTRSWSIDLKTGPAGKVIEGPASKADCTIVMSDTDCVAMFQGKLNAQQAFMQGKLKIRGDMKYAMKLGQVVGPKANM